jgi:hypothetical protein
MQDCSDKYRTNSDTLLSGVTIGERPFSALGGDVEQGLDLRFDPEYSPDAMDAAQLSQLTVMPGFPVAMRLWKSVVDEFLVQARNADTGNPLDCQEKIRRSQVSAQMFQLFTDKINGYTSAYKMAESVVAGAVAPDVTDKVLDLGEYADDLAGVENLFDTF